jgi:hypothetical protein
VAKQQFGNGSACYYGYDAAERVASIRHATSAGAPIAYFDYRRDAGGRITRIVRESDLAIYYQYDALNRLTSEVWAKKSTSAQIYAFTYLYDAAGNRRYQNRAYGVLATPFETAYYSYNAINALTKRYLTTSSSATYFAYASDGALTRMIEPSNSVTYYEYDSNRFIRRIVPPSGSAWTFTYDGLLNRVKILKGATPSYFLWSGMNQLEERDAASNLVARYTHGVGVIPGIGSVVEVQRPVGALTYYQYLHMDHQGSVAKVTEAGQNSQLTYSNDAFGRQIVGPAGSHLWLPNDVQFQSNWMTFTIGTRRYGLSPSRVYDPELGRFLQRDPFPNALKVAQSAPGNGLGIFARTIFEPIFRRYALQDLGGTNLFNYARANPIMWVDPTGLPETQLGPDPDGGGGGGWSLDTEQQIVAGQIPYLKREGMLSLYPNLKTWQDRVDLAHERLHEYNFPSKPGATWGDAGGLFLDWAMGAGPEHRDWGPDSPYTCDMKGARKVNEARDYFWKKNFGRSPGQYLPVRDYIGGFGLSGLWHAGLNPTQQFVGSFRVDITPQADGQIKFVLSNTTSMTSFLYGVGPSWSRDTLGVGGNMSQTIWWTEGPGK